jgi:hypothetical protein
VLKEFDQIQKTEQAIRGPQFDREQHGGLWDRGSADSWYSRIPEPHWYPEGTGNGAKVIDLNQYEIAEYMAGYEHNEQHGGKKSYD